MSVVACPGCAIGDAAGLAAPEQVTHQLVLPSIHCAGCISGVERALAAVPDITGARVNLTRKRVAIAATPGADPTPWIRALARAGFEAYEVADQDAPTPRAGEDYTVHMGVAGFAMMNVMLLSVAVWSGAVDTTRDFLHWVSAAIALPAAAFSAQPFFRSAARALLARRVNMDVPISLAILAACGMSLYEVMHSGAHAWFDAALTLTFFLLVGRVLDQRLRRAAHSAADNLAAMEPSRVLRLEDGLRVSRLLAEIRVGDTLWLTAGARVPVEAQLDAAASVDASFITGESAPVMRAAGAEVHAGEIVLTGPVMARATAVGEDTTLRRIAQLVATAEGARGQYTSLADKAAEIYTPLVHILAAAAFLGWLVATGDPRTAINVAIATLIITCPCALGLAVPAVAVDATARLYRAGLLIKSDTALERFAEVDTVVFDKTGTLTERRLVPPPVATDEERRALRALADASDHPLCRTLSQALDQVMPAPLSDLVEEAGQGVSARFGDRLLRLGRKSAGDPETVFEFGEAIYQLEAVEVPMSDAAHTVTELQNQGLRVVMLTGDTRENGARAADKLGIAEVFAEVDPEAKLAILQAFEAEGAKVLMVGDGLNDTAALAAAHVSMAPGTALDASRSAADAIIVSRKLATICAALRVSRRATRRMAQNIRVSTVYNLIAVPVALLGFATPLAASVAMSLSSITVVLNSIRGFAVGGAKS